MANALDYGAPDGGETRERDEVFKVDNDAMDAEMREWEQEYTGDAANFSNEREQKMREIIEGHRNKFYAMPRLEGIDAGAQRGVEPLAALGDDQLMGTEAEQGLPDVPSTIGKGLDIRYNVIHLTGLPVSKCSTSRLFAYVTHYGAQPLGLEWINDKSCNIVFSDPKAARLAAEYLCPSSSQQANIPLPNEDELEQAALIKRSHDKGENLEESQAFDWTDPFMNALLQPRRAHRIPGRLYLAPERDAAAELQAFDDQRKFGDGDAEMAPAADAPAIYRELEEEDRQRFLESPAQDTLRKIRSSLFVRWAVESFDVKGSKAASQSQWYREHGRDAGKEVVSKVLEVGGTKERRELLPSSGNGRAARGRNDRHSGQAAMDQLDREMDMWRDRADDAAVGHGTNARNRRRHGSRSAMTLDALDEEMEQASRSRDRSASPERRGKYASDSTSIRVRGRGKMRAPSAWDDDGHRSPQGSLSSRMNMDLRRNDRWNDDHSRSSLAQRLQPSSTGHLSQRLDHRLSPTSEAKQNDLVSRIR